MPKQTVLIVEDERSLCDVISYNLKREGFDVLTAGDGLEGLRKAQVCLPDLMILDLMLPVVEGLEVCRKLRDDSRTKALPILMLTARSEEVDELVGFQMGADDYVTKPFKMKPLVQRVKALLRRSQNLERSTDSLRCHGVEMDRVQHCVRVDDEEIQLTPTEFKLLWAFMRQPGRAFTRSELMDASMGEEAIVLDRTIDVHVKALRKKLDEKGTVIETVRGVGYRMRKP